MPMPVAPPKNPDSPLASLVGHHVGIRVPDYAAAVAWYTEKLDFRILHEWPYGELKLAYLMPANDDDFHIEILAGPVPFPKEVLDDLGVSLRYGGYQHICVHVDNVDDVRAELSRRGVDLLGEPFLVEDISRKLAFLRDPWGNMIELSETLPGAGA
ncbi:VOC family protein [Kribbella qitaiheensis]|uniref:VOC family protein n=1 Tax=Kribbella qitaiheensis TaxID=1544730 RepID=UPI00362400E0